MDIPTRAPSAGPGARLPYFDLADSRGGTTNVWRFRGRRNLVLVFAGNEGCEPCLALLRAIGDRYEEYKEEEAEVLGIVRVANERLGRLAERLRLPFPLLADPEGRAHERYGADGDLAVYATDRFGEIQERWFARESEVDQEQVLARLRFVGLQCPE